MKTTLALLATGLLAASSASAAINIDTVFVGDAGNANDTANPYGGVGYNYHIGTYAVTNMQYASFLSSVASASDPYGLYNANMNSSTRGGITQGGSPGSFTYTVKNGMGNKPVNYVSFWDAARFSNWLTNGQGDGDTETGMYNLNGITEPTNDNVTRQLDFSAGQHGVAVASENEWYKAAYYDGNGDYFAYPTQSNTAPTATGPNSTDANSANFNFAVNNLTDVGSYTIAGSHYGTFDQGGNLREWNDTMVFSFTRGLRGGSFEDGAESLNSSTRESNFPTGESYGTGFRITSLQPIPEPSAYAVILGGFGLGLAMMRRKRRNN